MFITSANSVLTLTQNKLYPVPQVMQGYAVDDAFTIDAIDIAEAQVGVDGLVSFGYTPSVNNVTISLQADSPSIGFFEYLIAATKAAKEVFILQGTLLIPSTGKSYVMSNGALTNATLAPAGKKVLAPQSFTITFSNISSAIV